MLIRVVYEHGGFDMIKPNLLDHMLRKNRVRMFERAGGWAIVGKVPLREESRNQSYPGPERRAMAG